MKNLSEQILRFKQLSGLINETDKKGCIEGDCQNGTGKYVYGGFTYEGEFKNGKRNGKGKFVFDHGATYEGEVKDDKYDGYGKEVYSDGSYYEGEFKNGKYAGHGKKYSSDGNLIDVYKDGEIIKVGCVEGDCQNGTGKYIVSDGNYYKGEFKNGKYNGKGILYIENKKTADGRFVDGFLKYGKKFRYNGDEVVYFDEGEWDKNGKLDGGGKRQYMGYGVENKNPRNIHIEEGTFKNGVLEKGTIEYENGKKFTGTFEYVGDKVKFTSEDGLITTDDLDSYSISGKTPLNKKTTGFCVVGNCNNGEGEYLGPLGSYKGSFKNNLFNDLSGDATLDTNVNQNDFALENFDLTKNFHTYLFKYTGQFVDGEFDGEGTIEFSDGVIYEGDFNENKIEGIGTFTFKDGSIYQGKVETEDVDGSKSKYILDYGNGTIDDVINYNSKNYVEILKLEDSEKVTDDDSDSDVYDYTDLNIYFSETKGNPGIVKYVDKNEYPQIKDKKVKITLEYIGDKTIKKEGRIDTGYFKFEGVRIGRYNLTADGKGLNEFKTIVDIDEDTKELTILLKNSNMKEEFLVNKIKKMLFESVDDIKVGDCFEYTGNVGETPNWYIKVTKIVDKENCLVDGIQETILDGQIEFYKNMEFRLSDLDQSIPENSRRWSLTTNDNYLKIKKEYLDKVEKEGKKFVGTDYSNNSSLTIDVAKEDLPKNTNVDQETKNVDTPVVEMKVGDYYKILNYYSGSEYGKIIKINSVEFPYIVNSIYSIGDFLTFNINVLVNTDDASKLIKIEKKEYDEFLKNSLEKEGVSIHYIDYDTNLEYDKLTLDEFKNKPEYKNIIDSLGVNISTTQKQTIPTTTPTTQKPIENKKAPNENINIEICENLISEFYQDFLNVWRGQPLPKDLGDLESNKRKVEACVTRFGHKIKKKRSKKHKMSFEDVINTLKNIPPGTDETIKFEDYFEITPDESNIRESKDIYSNSITNSIMKVLKEHSVNKKVITTESNIIKNRLDFIYKTSNNYDLKFNLLKESKELIKKGYNENVVKTYYRRLII